MKQKVLSQSEPLLPLFLQFRVDWTLFFPYQTFWEVFVNLLLMKTKKNFRLDLFVPVPDTFKSLKSFRRLFFSSFLWNAKFLWSFSTFLFSFGKWIWFVLVDFSSIASQTVIIILMAQEYHLHRDTVSCESGVFDLAKLEKEKKYYYRSY